jgi:hypothetical protein
MFENNLSKLEPMAIGQTVRSATAWQMAESLASIKGCCMTAACSNDSRITLFAILPVPGSCCFGLA